MKEGTVVLSIGLYIVSFVDKLHNCVPRKNILRGSRVLIFVHHFSENALLPIMNLKLFLASSMSKRGSLIANRKTRKIQSIYMLMFSKNNIVRDQEY